LVINLRLKQICFTRQVTCKRL